MFSLEEDIKQRSERFYDEDRDQPARHRALALIAQINPRPQEKPDAHDGNRHKEAPEIFISSAHRKGSEKRHAEKRQRRQYTAEDKAYFRFLFVIRYLFGGKQGFRLIRRSVKLIGERRNGHAVLSFEQSVEQHLLMRGRPFGKIDHSSDKHGIFLVLEIDKQIPLGGKPIDHRGDVLVVHRSVDKLTHAQGIHILRRLQAHYGDNLPLFTEEEKHQHGQAQPDNSHKQKHAHARRKDARGRISPKHARLRSETEGNRRGHGLVIRVVVF